MEFGRWATAGIQLLGSFSEFGGSHGDERWMD